MMIGLIWSLLTLSLYASPLFGPWDGRSDPLIMSSSFERNFYRLPLQGHTKKTKRFWSGDYWADRYGGINYRWYAQDKFSKQRQSPTKDEVRRMTIPELATLSPAEKYDLFLGRYDYPLRNEVAKLANPKALIWEGICHGWAPATMNHDEPVPRLMMNPDGIEIPFGSTDIKALLSYYYAHGFITTTTHQLGQRCYQTRANATDPNCHEDLNAGAFHMVLSNKIGIEGVGVLADLQRYEQVWNNPLMAYTSQVVQELAPGARAARGTTKVLRIKTEVTYPDNGENRWQTVLGTRYQVTKKFYLMYDLELDAYGNIIGGEWRSEDRPDFLWLKARPWKFEGTLYRLGDLLND